MSFCSSRRYRMRIAQVAPLAESVPPQLYGGTERIVSYLTEELVRQGHDVTLFASGDSHTAAELVRCCDVALRLNPDVRDALPYHLMMLEQCARPPPSSTSCTSTSTCCTSRCSQLADSARDDAARPARPAGSAAVLPRIPRRAAGLDLRRPAPADAAGELGRHRLITACRATCCAFARRRAAAISPSSAASRRRSGPTARSRSRHAPACR